MEDRYCRNCGHELSQDDRFCPNCGRPVHETAHVPTPEADVPVPPPPQQAGGTGAAPQQPPPQQEGGRRRTFLLGCFAIFLLFFVVVIALASGGGGGGGGGDVADNPRQEGQNEAQQDQPQKKAQGQEDQPQQQGGGEQEPEQPSFGDGVYQVGADIQPGTYRTREGSAGCYYARLGGFSNELDDILANANTNAPAIVTIKPTDAGFESQLCGTWTKDLSPITQSKTSFGEGAYFVGRDIEPGTYRSSGGSQCYYERLRGFSGDLNSIIANGNATAPTIVTIKPTDTGFQSQGCGTWTKLE